MAIVGCEASSQPPAPAAISWSGEYALHWDAPSCPLEGIAAFDWLSIPDSDADPAVFSCPDCTVAPRLDVVIRIAGRSADVLEVGAVHADTSRGSWSLAPFELTCDASRLAATVTATATVGGAEHSCELAMASSCTASDPANLDGFCGFATCAACQTDDDCVVDGCSGGEQVKPLGGSPLRSDPPGDMIITPARMATTSPREGLSVPENRSSRWLPDHR